MCLRCTSNDQLDNLLWNRFFFKTLIDLLCNYQPNPIMDWAASRNILWQQKALPKSQNGYWQNTKHAAGSHFMQTAATGHSTTMPLTFPAMVGREGEIGQEERTNGGRELAGEGESGSNDIHWMQFPVFQPLHLFPQTSTSYRAGLDLRRPIVKHGAFGGLIGNTVIPPSPPKFSNPTHTHQCWLQYVPF